MYTFFYPETDEQLPGEFKTVNEAVEYWRDRRWSWSEIKATRPGDLVSFMNSTTGEIVVLRKTD